MNKIFIFIACLLSNLFAYDALDVSSIDDTFNAKKYMYCTSDAKNIFSFEDIVKKDDLTRLEKSNLGYVFKTYWCRLKLKNKSNFQKNFILSNPRSGVDFIDVNVYQKNSLKKYSLGDMVALKNRSYPSVFSNFELSLGANESATIVSRYYTDANLELSWNIQNFHHFMQYENLNFILIFVFFGFIFAMMIYKFFIYLHIKDKAYLAYSTMMLTILISQASLQGSLHYFFSEYLDFYTISISSAIFTHLFLVFMWVFTFYFFNIDKSSRFYYLLFGVISYNILITVLYISSYIYVDILKLTPIIVLIALLESIFLLIFSIVMFMQKKAGSGYFLIGHFLYIFAILNYIFVLDGLLEFSLIARHSSSFGIFLVISFMSLALSARFKVLEDENEENKKHIERNKQYMLIGTTISYITHQWKQPLSIMSAQVLSMSAKIEHVPDCKISSIKNRVVELENSISYINDTLSSVKKLFINSNVDNSVFMLKNLVNEIEKNLDNLLEISNITIKYDILDTHTLSGNRNLFLHAITNIIQNSIEAFDSDNDNNFISITTKKDDGNMILSIKDNAGGIQISPIESIFEPSVTKKAFGTGIGLALTKNILESNFKASISVENSEVGAKFTLLIPYM